MSVGQSDFVICQPGQVKLHDTQNIGPGLLYRIQGILNPFPYDDRLIQPIIQSLHLFKACFSHQRNQLIRPDRIIF